MGRWLFQWVAALPLVLAACGPNAPEVVSTSQSADIVSAHATVTLQVEARASSGNRLTFSWGSNVGTLGTPESTDTESKLVWTAPRCLPFDFAAPVTVTLKDERGGSTSRRFTLRGTPGCAPGEAGPGGTWTPVGGMSYGTTHHTATLLLSGKVLVTGGRPVSSISGSTTIHAFGTAEVYDPTTGTWARTSGMLSNRTEHAAVLLPSGKVLVTGGLEKVFFPQTGKPTDYVLATAEVYDPATGTWTPTGSMASPRMGHVAVLLPSGKVLVVGGTQNSWAGGAGLLTTTELYDPVTGTWAPSGSMASGHLRHTATLLPSGKVLAVGGYSELYDPNTNNWSPAGGTMEIPEEHTATLLPSGKLLVAGAMAVLYDPATDSWSRTSPMNFLRYAHAAALLPSGKVLLVGGIKAGSSNPYLKEAEVYDPATDTWTVVSGISEIRITPTATLLPSGEILLVGGDNFNVAQNTTELYSP